MSFLFFLMYLISLTLHFALVQHAEVSFFFLLNGDPSDCVHQSVSLASATLSLLLLLLPFMLLLPFHASVLQSFCLFWHCHSCDEPFSYQSLPLPFLLHRLFQLFLPASHHLLHLCLPWCLSESPMHRHLTRYVVLFVVRANSAEVITFITVPACSLLSFALAFAFTLPVLPDYGILGDLIFPLFSLIPFAQSLKHVRG